jgi:drug/metabolite transporter (DMT)-like permease
MTDALPAAPAAARQVTASVGVHLALLFVQLTFGAFHVISKGLLVVLPPLALAGIRALAAMPLLLVLAWRVERVLPRRRDLPALAGLGLLGVTANQLLYILGLRLTSASSASILMPSVPVFAIAIGAALGIERFDRRRLAGVALAVAGALVMLGVGGLAGHHGALAGELLILGNCAAYAAYLVLQRPLLCRLPPLTLVAWAFAFGGTATAAVCAPALRHLDPAALPASAWWGLAYVVLLPTAVNYVLIAWAVRHSSPALVAAYTTLQPVVATSLAVLFLGEAPGAHAAVGLALIVSGLAAINARPAGPVTRSGSSSS